MFKFYTRNALNWKEERNCYFTFFFYSHIATVIGRFLAIFPRCFHFISSEYCVCVLPHPSSFSFFLVRLRFVLSVHTVYLLYSFLSLFFFEKKNSSHTCIHTFIYFMYSWIEPYYTDESANQRMNIILEQCSKCSTTVDRQFLRNVHTHTGSCDVCLEKYISGEYVCIVHMHNCIQLGWDDENGRKDIRGVGTV